MPNERVDFEKDQESWTDILVTRMEKYKQAGNRLVTENAHERPIKENKCILGIMSQLV